MDRRNRQERAEGGGVSSAGDATHSGSIVFHELQQRLVDRFAERPISAVSPPLGPPFTQPRVSATASVVTEIGAVNVFSIRPVMFTPSH